MNLTRDAPPFEALREPRIQIATGGNRLSHIPGSQGFLDTREQFLLFGLHRHQW
jgi:hypothetical protein